MDYIIKYTIYVVFIIFQLGVPFLAAYAISYGAIRLLRSRGIQRKLRQIFVPCLIAIVIALVALIQHPILSCPPELQPRLTQEIKREAIHIGKDVTWFPFFTAEITIKDIREDGIVTIEPLYLFVFARAEIEFGGADGPDVTQSIHLIW